MCRYTFQDINVEDVMWFSRGDWNKHDGIQRSEEAGLSPIDLITEQITS